MAIGWLSVLKAVPWTEVIANAPKVAEGARKLWNGATRKASSPATEAAPGSPPPSTAELEASIHELRQQLVDSSALITSLAEQNAQLVAHVERNRRRVLWLAGACAIALILGAGSLILWLLDAGI